MPTTLQQLVTDHVHALRSAGHRHKRIADSRRQLDLFTTWAEIAGVTQLDQLSLDVIDAYHEHLLLLRNDNGYSLNLMVQRERLAKLRRWLSWLHTHGWLNIDLSAGVPTAKRQAAHSC